MPTSTEFCKGYGLKIGMKIGHFQLKSMDIDEKSIVRFNEYAYLISLAFEAIDKKDVNKSDGEDLLLYVSELFSANDKLIRTASNRPYRCQFHDPHKAQPSFDINEHQEVILHFTGHAKRIKNSEAADME